MLFGKIRRIALVTLLLSVAIYAKVTVAVSMPAYAGVISQIAGEQVDVVVLIPANADPHTFEPKPAQLKAFSKAQYYFSDGSILEKAWMPRFKGVNKKVKEISIGSDVGFRFNEEGEMDPHIWTSPKMLRKISANICRALLEIDPPNKEFYQQRYVHFINKLGKLDDDFARAVRKIPEKQRGFLVFHPTFTYLLADYEFAQLPIEINGKEPKPKDLKEMIAEAKRMKIRLFVKQPQYNNRSVKMFIKELDLDVVEIDPMSQDVMGNIRKFIDGIYKSLSPR